MNRRNFIKGLLAAPAVVAIDHIMPVRSIERLLIPTIWGDGIHDDAPGLQAILRGDRVLNLAGVTFQDDVLQFPIGAFKINAPVDIPQGVSVWGGGDSLDTKVVIDAAYGFGILTGSRTELKALTLDQKRPDAPCLFVADNAKLDYRKARAVVPWQPGDLMNTTAVINFDRF